MTTETKVEGLTALREWIPEFVVGLAQSGHAVPAADVRDALVLTVAGAGFMLGAQVVLSLLRGTSNLLAGRSLSRRRDGFLGVLRKGAMLAVIAVPVWNLAQLATDGVALPDAEGFTILAGLAWAGLHAMDHRAVWLDVDEGVVRARRGFAIFRRHLLTLELTHVFRDRRGSPVGQLKGLNGRTLGIASEAVEALAPYRGGEDAARRYLAEVLRKLGAKPAPT